MRGSGCNDAPQSPTGQCTNAPSTWYNNAGNDLCFWPKKLNGQPWGPAKATYETTLLSQYGMVLVWHGTIEQALALPNSKFRPGDVSTQYYYSKIDRNGTPSSPSAHGCMWTGHDWRSDFIQATIMANSAFKDANIKGNRDYSVCIWRHPDFQEPGQTVVPVT